MTSITSSSLSFEDSFAMNRQAVVTGVIADAVPLGVDDELDVVVSLTSIFDKH